MCQSFVDPVNIPEFGHNRADAGSGFGQVLEHYGIFAEESNMTIVSVSLLRVAWKALIS